MNKDWIYKVGQKFQMAEKIMVVSHIRPDGDAIGSVLGLGLSLQLIGKQVQMVLSDAPPPPVRPLPVEDQRRHPPDAKSDMSGVVDSSDLQKTEKS